MKCISLLFLISIFIFTCSLSCIQPPDLPDEPVITFTGVSKNTIDQGSLNQDSLVVFFNFTDGDGDIGVEPSMRRVDNFDLFVFDTRTGNLQDRFFMPHVPPKGAGNGITGSARVVLFGTCCIYEDGTADCEANEDEPTDTIVYEIFIIDRAGNESNRIQTTPITINCN